MGKNNRGRGNRGGDRGRGGRGRGGGGRGGGGGGRGRGRGGGGGGDDERQHHGKWADIKKESPEMEAYYKEQKILKEEDWPAFLAAARANLPTTFRISPVVTFAGEMKKNIRSHFADLKIEELTKDMDEEDERLKAPEPIPWYPDDLAWGMRISKKALKRTPALERFHKYLVAETETGNITRQEAVSMIPPLFMEVEPHHRVLDMCAAPGSKTSQCLELLHAKCGATGVPAGVVIANDADLDRCINTHTHTHTHTHRERERERERDMYICIYVYM